MEKTDNVKLIKVEHKPNETPEKFDWYEDVKFKVPICKKCLAHEKQATAWKDTIMFLCVGIAIAISLFCNIKLQMDTGIPFAIGLVCYICLFFLITSIVKLPKLVPTHGSRINPVRVEPVVKYDLDFWKEAPKRLNTPRCQYPYVHFFFTNWEFASLFYMVNECKNIEFSKGYESRYAELYGSLRSCKSLMEGCCLAGAIIYCIICWILRNV